MSGGHKVSFYAWLGIDGNEDGWDSKPSVWKCFEVSTPVSEFPARQESLFPDRPGGMHKMLTAPKGITKSGHGGDKALEKATQLFPGPNLTAAFASLARVLGEDADENVVERSITEPPIGDWGTIPAGIQRVIKEWHQKYGNDTIPDFAIARPAEDLLAESRRGNSSHFEDTEGNHLQAKAFPLKVPRKSILVVWSLAQMPVIIKTAPSGHKGGSAFRRPYCIWQGIENGFEKKASIWKIFSPHTEGVGDRDRTSIEVKAFHISIRRLADTLTGQIRYGKCTAGSLYMEAKTDRAI